MERTDACAGSLHFLNVWFSTSASIFVAENGAKKPRVAVNVWIIYSYRMVFQQNSLPLH